MSAVGLFETVRAISNSENGEVEILDQIVNCSVNERYDDQSVRYKERAILQMGEMLKKSGKAVELCELIRATRPFLALISKAMASKLVRSLVDMFLSMNAGTGVEVQLCEECISWANTEKRTFLRQFLQCRLIALYYDTQQYTLALQVGSALLRELKKLDDKNLLVEVQLLESKTYHALSNLPKARAALTSARTTANAIYIVPRLQAALDMQSGILHAADEHDFKTAYSYFYESFDGYDATDQRLAVRALKYMLMCRVMMGCYEDVTTVVGAKLALKYAGREVDCMRAVLAASNKRSLADFQQALDKYSAELSEDPVVRTHLSALYDTMLEQNVCRIIEPYSHVQLSHVANCVGLPCALVERKLSQMILDAQICGVLDQHNGALILYDSDERDETYESAIQTVAGLSLVVTSLFARASKLS